MELTEFSFFCCPFWRTETRFRDDGGKGNDFNRLVNMQMSSGGGGGVDVVKHGASGAAAVDMQMSRAADAVIDSIGRGRVSRLSQQPIGADWSHGVLHQSRPTVSFRKKLVPSFFCRQHRQPKKESTLPKFSKATTFHCRCFFSFSLNSAKEKGRRAPKMKRKTTKPTRTKSKRKQKRGKKKITTRRAESLGS